MPSRKLQRTIRRLNLKPRRAILGDRNGVLYEPGRTGYVRVRYPASAENTDALAYPTTIRLTAIVPMKPGQPVMVGYDYDNEIAVIGGDFSGALASGGTPLVYNPSDDNIFRFLDQRDITTLRCQRVGPGAPMSVSVLGWVYVKDGIYHGFIGEQVNLTSLIPGSADQHLLALVALKTDDTLEVVTSTVQDIDDPFDSTDVQECVTALTAGSLPVHLWVLENGMAELTEASDYMDMRQFLNTSTDTGSDATVSTTDATVTTLVGVTVAEGYCTSIDAVIVGSRDDESAGIGGRAVATARRAAAGNVTLVGSDITVYEDSAGTPTFTADIDTGTQTLRIRVTGIAAQNWRWRTSYRVIRT